MQNNLNEIRKQVEQQKARSAWARGVKLYAFDFVDTLEEWQDYENTNEIPTGEKLKKVLLNGAGDWVNYSWAGCSLCYDGQIAERLCSPSELKKTCNGNKRPNASEEWLDVQARAIFQA